MKILEDMYSYLKRLYARHFGFSLADLKVAHNRSNEMQGSANIRGQLYRRWRIFFAALITFWLIVMFVFCVSLFSQSREYTPISRRKVHIGNIPMNNPYFGVFYKLKKDTIDLDVSLGNRTVEDDNGSGSLMIDKLLEGRLRKMKRGGNFAGDLGPGLDKPDNEIGIDSFRLQRFNRHDNAAIEDLPRDEISKEQISDMKLEFSIIDEVPQNKTAQNNGSSVHERHNDMSIMEKDNNTNNGSLQSISNHDMTSQINATKVDEPILSRQNQSLNLQEKTRPATKDNRPEGYFAKMLRTQQQPQNKEVLEAFEAYKAFKTQKNGIYKKFPINGAQKNHGVGYREVSFRTQSPNKPELKNALSSANIFLNVKQPPNLFNQRQNGDSYKRASFGIQSRNRPVFRNALIRKSFENRLVQHQNDILYNNRKQDLLQQRQVLVGHQPVNISVGNQRKGNNVYNKQGMKTRAPVGFMARIMPKYNIYKQQQQQLLQRQQLLQQQLQQLQQQLRQQQQQQQQQQPVNPPFKSLFLQKLIGDAYNKQLQNPIAPVGSLKDTYKVRNTAQDNSYQQQRRNAYERPAMKTGPKYGRLLRNPAVNNQIPKQNGRLYSKENIPINSEKQQQIQNPYGRRADPRYQSLFRNPVNNNQLNNNQVQKQTGQFYSGERSNVFPLNRSQKEFVRDPFNRKSVQSKTGNAYNEPKIDFEQTISDNVEPQNQAISDDEHVDGSYNKAAGEHMVKLNGDGNGDINSKQSIGDQNDIWRTAQHRPQNQAVFGSERAQGSFNKVSGQNIMDELSGDINEPKKNFEQAIVEDDSDQFEPENQTDLESRRADYSPNEANGQIMDKFAQMNQEKMGARLKALYERFLTEENASQKFPTASEQRKVPDRWPSEFKVKQTPKSPTTLFTDF